MKEIEDALQPSLKCPLKPHVLHGVFKWSELPCVLLPGGLASNGVPPWDGSCAVMGEYKGWHVFVL